MNAPPHDPNDCTLEVTLDDKDPDKQKLLLARMPSTGSSYKRVTFDHGSYDLKVATPPFVSAHRFTIAFLLPASDKSGGFAGIKIWPDGTREPDRFEISTGTPDGTYVIKDTPFDLDCFTTDPNDQEKITLMSLGDTCAKTAVFRYCVAVYPTAAARKAGGPIVREDPRVHNTGDIGGCLGKVWRAFLLFFGLWTRRS